MAKEWKTQLRKAKSQLDKGLISPVEYQALQDKYSPTKKPDPQKTPKPQPPETTRRCSHGAPYVDGHGYTCFWC